MGDGRYYTWMQFFRVGTLTALIVGLCSCFVYYYYRLSKLKPVVSMASLVLLLGYLTQYVYTIAVDNIRIQQMAQYSAIFMFLHLGLCLMLISSLYLEKLNLASHIKPYFICSYCAIISLGIFRLGDTIFDALVFVNFIALINCFTEYRISGSVFSTATQMLNQFIFILNADKTIIYKNKAVISTDYFNQSDILDIDKLEKIFNYPISIRHDYQQHFIKLQKIIPVYLSYTKKELTPSDQSAIIITFTDVTELINLLDDLDVQRANVSKKNVELTQQKERVYEAERQKEIVHLLDQIANRQQRTMYQLKDEIEHLDVDQNEITEQIEALINQSKAALADVRAAVSMYKQL